MRYAPQPFFDTSSCLRPIMPLVCVWERVRFAFSKKLRLERLDTRTNQDEHQIHLSAAEHNKGEGTWSVMTCGPLFVVPHSWSLTRSSIPEFLASHSVSTASRSSVPGIEGHSGDKRIQHIKTTGTSSGIVA